MSIFKKVEYDDICKQYSKDKVVSFIKINSNEMDIFQEMIDQDIVNEYEVDIVMAETIYREFNTIDKAIKWSKSICSDLYMFCRGDKIYISVYKDSEFQWEST